MKPLNEILGYLGNPDAQSLSDESQLKLVQNIEMLLFNYDSWYRYNADKLSNTSFTERFELFKINNKEIVDKL